jgi:hypothetical protein
MEDLGAAGMSRALEELLARRQIEDLVLRYSRGIDRLDAEAVRSCYHPDGTDEHTGFSGVRDDFVEWVMAAVRRFDGTMHLVCNHYSEVDGERAVAESYGLAYHWGSPREDIRRNFVSAFRYVDRLERREGEWRIAARAAVREWTRALDPADWIPPEGKAPEGSRDAEDPIYRAGAVRLDRRP